MLAVVLTVVLVLVRGAGVSPASPASQPSLP